MMAPLARMLRNFVPKRCTSQVTPEFTERQKRLYPQVKQTITEEGYPLLKFAPLQKNIFAPRSRTQIKRRERAQLKPRENDMQPDIDWPSIWPTPKTFTPSAVPLPIRQSYPEKVGEVPIGKYANTELLKITNFLHLTPVAIQRHCKVLKKFCTKWPEGLDTEEDVRSHFPVTIVTRDYLHSAPTIRDPRARVVQLVININDLRLNEREMEKFELLVGERLNKETKMLTITTDACPSRVQNEDYASYLLTAVYFESKKREDWEDEKPEDLNIFRDIDEYRDQVEKSLGFK